MRHGYGTLRCVGSLGVRSPVAIRAALLSGTVVGVRLGQRHELPRPVDPHLACGLVESRHGGQVPRGGSRRQRVVDTARYEGARPAEGRGGLLPSHRDCHRRSKPRRGLPAMQLAATQQVSPRHQLGWRLAARMLFLGPRLAAHADHRIVGSAVLLSNGQGTRGSPASRPKLHDCMPTGRRKLLRARFLPAARVLSACPSVSRGRCTSDLARPSLLDVSASYHSLARADEMIA